MKETLLIAGCGYLGTVLGTDWAESGAVAYGMRRNIEALQNLATLNIRPAFGNLLDMNTLIGLPEFDFVVICQAMSQKTDNYSDTYYEGTRNLLLALKGREPQKLIFISSTSVYGTSSGSWIDETSDPGASGYSSEELAEHAKILLETEKMVLSSSIPSAVLRLGGIYGPGRNRIKPLKEGKTKPVFSDVYTNRIHVEDVVSAIKLLIKKGPAGEIYLGVDDAPCMQREFYGWLCDKLSLKVSGEASIDTVAARASNKRCSNKKIKKLGMKFKYPSFREGYEALLSSPNVFIGDPGMSGSPPSRG